MLTVAQIAALLDASFEGDGERRIERGAALDVAGPDELSFLENARGGASGALASRAGCLILPSGVAAPEGCCVVRAARPRNAFARALAALQPPSRPAPGVHPTAVLDASVELGEGVAVGPQAVVEADVRLGPGVVVGPGCWIGEGSTIGTGSTLASGVRIYPGTRVGARAILHAGVVLGADGFGFVFEGGRYEKFPQVGRVRIGDDVEIGANSCVDRGALGETVIEDGVKLDNLVHIAHNCRLGKHVVIAAQTGLSGGVVVEDYVVMGGQVGIGDKARIGRQAVLGGQAGVLTGKTIAGGEQYWGTPVRPVREHLKNLGRVEKLAELMAEVRALKARIRALEEAE